MCCAEFEIRFSLPRRLTKQALRIRPWSATRREFPSMAVGYKSRLPAAAARAFDLGRGPIRATTCSIAVIFRSESKANRSVRFILPPQEKPNYSAQRASSAGTPWTGAGRFQYAGSIGPLPTNPDLQRQLLQLGSRLAQAFGLIGLFGVDAILAGNTAWPVEVNPRLPASAEILERSLGLNAIACHMDACQNGNIKISEIQSDFSPPNEGPRSHGKAILYAACDTIIDDRLLDRIREKKQRPRRSGDRRHPYARHSCPGGASLYSPFFAAGPNRQIVEQRLQSLAAEFLTAPAA